jgi:hypothetical protein
MAHESVRAIGDVASPPRGLHRLKA